MSTQPVNNEVAERSTDSKCEWRILAKEAAHEKDPQKLLEIIASLTAALEKRNAPE